MPRLFCQDHPGVAALEARVVDSRPGAVLLDRSPFFPGGGGQLPDRGTLEWEGGLLAVVRLVPDGRGLWHEFDGEAEPHGMVMARIDGVFRNLMCELHTVAHVANSIVYREFGGALLTGAQLSADGTFRVDFDLPDIDPDRLRSLGGPINDALRQDFPIRTFRMPWSEAEATSGMFRSKSVSPPPQEDGTVRIVEIIGLDRQACGGTHLETSGAARPIRILKVDNKGRQNRRIKIGLAET
ncbi:alanyl-tRNA editing protein [Microvirga subterranea]|uniref:Ala-tRNA(Pro) hydrolase n=1 Tax=Microvirga subterranea TaxID=186651 RepID=A0A370HGW7_9HYPH|nr:Ala-tRNA(Pro) hydrolase [Microvirga subterranea]